jgi:hypothetical protein
VASGRIQFYFAGKKEPLPFTPKKPIFDEKQVRKKQPKKKGSKKPKPTEETEEPGKNKPKPRRTWWKKNPCARRSSREPHWKVLLLHFHCI